MIRTPRRALDRHSLLIPALVLATLGAPVAAQPSRMPPPGWPASPKQFDAVQSDTNLMVPTRDGVRLATDIFRPARNGVPAGGRFPLLLNRTPYDKDELHSQAIFFAERGYVVAVQDARGRFKSEGVFSKVQPADATDGYDVIEWLAKRPYTTGQVGMWGTSFAAHFQAGAAQLKPPSLKALVLNMGGMSNAWDHGVRFRGTYEMGRQLTWAWNQMIADAREPHVRALLEKEKVEDWFSVVPLRRGQSPLSVWPEYEAWYHDFFEKADYDAYWKDPMMAWDEHYPETSDIPMLQVGGWYDIFLEGTFKNFLGLKALKRSPQHVLVGPWTHGGNHRSYAGDVSYGPDAAIVDFATEFHVRWFDQHLKGKTPPSERAPVRVFVMGTADGRKDADGRLVHGGYWLDAPSWPVPGTRSEDWFFQPGGGLSKARPTTARSSTTYTFDPRDPVPTIGGGASARLKDGAYDQREDPRFPPSAAPFLPLRARADVVVFESEPLTEDMTVIGPIKVVVHASASTVDTDLTAKLIDVYPPSATWPGGFDLNLTDAIVRARYRASREKAEFLVPGRVYEFTIAPFPTANVFKKGHRIRVDISSSNFPRFDVNPNTGEPIGLSRRTVTSDITLHHSATYASHIVLPIAPARR
jgi:putative CocE/NonD family hydrolase